MKIPQNSVEGNFHKGMAIAVPKKYEALCLENVERLRGLGCALPIEIWEVGSEMTRKARERFANLPGISLRNAYDVTSNPRHWRGFQIKALALKHTQFDEVIIADADVIFHQLPTMLFEDAGYLLTGSYFFRDLDKWTFSNLRDPWTQLMQKVRRNKFTSASFFQKRREWITSLLPSKSALFPSEWQYIYETEIPHEPVKEALMEAGVVAINRIVHRASIGYIYDLNDRHPETYKFVWGDKETFWIGCVMANQPFFFNPVVGYISRQTGRLSHDYRGHLFYSQKR